MEYSKLKTLIKEKGMTQKDLAEKLGIGQNTLSNLVKGKCLPRKRTALIIAEELGCDVSDVFEFYSVVQHMTVKA